MKCITLEYGAEDPLVLEPREGALVGDCRGPDGVAGAAARGAVAHVLASPAEGPPLAGHVVPGDRVTIAISDDLPQAADVVAAVVDVIAAAGVRPEDVVVLRSPPVAGLAGCSGPLQPLAVPAGVGGAIEFDPTVETQTSYIAADSEGNPIHVARALVDADVVVAVGGWGWDAAFGGRAIEGELWPAFSRQICRQNLLVSLAGRGRRALAEWRARCDEAMWQLGLCASLRVVPGRGDTLHAAAFGMPASAARQARALSAAWSQRAAGMAAVTVASLSDPRGTPAALLRGVAAAARVTHPAGTICVASRIAEPPGLIFARWREGAALQPLVREALGTGDRALIADAFLTRFFAHALGDRRLVLLCDLEESAVEGLELGYAATAEVVERLAHRAESLSVLHEADRMLPRF